MATVINDIQPGQSPNPNGSPVFPGTTFTGPILAGNVINSDGTGNLAGLGNTYGTQNIGYAVMAQSAVVTQANGACAITIPAQSQILSITMMVTTAWTGVATTFAVGATAGTTNVTAFAPLSQAGGSTGRVAISPSTAAQIANWDNVSNATFQTGGASDVQIVVTSTNTGSGVGTLTVTYIQGINNAS